MRACIAAGCLVNLYVTIDIFFSVLDTDTEITRVTPPPTPSPTPAPLAGGLVIDVEKLKKSPRHQKMLKTPSPSLRHHHSPHSPHSPQSPHSPTHTKISIHESLDQAPRIRSSPSSSSSSAPPTPSPTHTSLSLQKRSAVSSPVRTVNLQPTIAVLPPVHSSGTYAAFLSSSSSSSSSSHSIPHTGTYAAMHTKPSSKTKDKTKTRTKLTKPKTKTKDREPVLPLVVPTPPDLGLRGTPSQATPRDHVVIAVVRDFKDYEVEAKVKINHAAMLSPEE